MGASPQGAGEGSRAGGASPRRLQMRRVSQLMCRGKHPTWVSPVPAKVTHIINGHKVSVPPWSAQNSGHRNDPLPHHATDPGFSEWTGNFEWLPPGFLYSGKERVSLSPFLCVIWNAFYLKPEMRPANHSDTGPGLPGMLWAQGAWVCGSHPPCRETPCPPALGPQPGLHL